MSEKRYIVAHRSDRMFFAGVVNASPMWTPHQARAHRFQSAEGAFTTTFVVCLSTDPQNLEVVELGSTDWLPAWTRQQSA